jgi:DNA-binding transcriptional LysR family regulator
MEIFRRVVDAGGMTAAARDLHLGQASVSRTVAELEQWLGVQLVHRGPPLVPTDAGRLFYTESAIILERLDHLEADMRSDRSDPRGLLRIACNAGFAIWVLMPMLPVFHEAYPGIQLELMLEEQATDLVLGGLDAAIHVGPLDEPGLKVRRLGMARYGLFAAPSYLARHPEPKEPADLTRHDWCLPTAVRGDQKVDLHRPDGTKTQVALNACFFASGSEVLRRAVLSGLGPAILPLSTLQRDTVANGGLTRILPDWEATPQDIAVIWPTTRHLPHRVRAFIDFMVEHTRRAL